MNIESRQLLRKQLEQQARLFTTGQDDTKLAVSVLSTCSALLRAVEKNMPKSFSQAEFEGVFAGYLGVINRVNNFYKNNTVYFSEEESGALGAILTSLEKAEMQKKELDGKLAEERNKYNIAKAEAEKREKLLDAETQKYNELMGRERTLKNKLQGVRDKIAALENELANTNADIKNSEAYMENLIQEVLAARETYEEMMAYYSELQRVQSGIKEEGYVDMDSFLERLHAMNTSGTELMARYDSLLKNLTSDIESLQDKIEKRRKAGMIG